jgi:hypothetical protein
MKRTNVENTRRADLRRSARNDSKKPRNHRKTKKSKSKNARKGRSEFEERAFQELMAWRRRPRIHPAALNKPERTAELIRMLGSDQRLALFKELASKYVNLPSLDNYLRLRREIPEAEIDVAVFGGFEVLFALDSDLKKHGIDPDLVAGILDAFEPAIDKLSLRLMECLSVRSKIHKSGPKHIERRREAIRDALVDYLIVLMLEAMEWNKSHPIVIPSSLIVLIRDRLCGPNPDWHEAYRSRRERECGVYGCTTL